MPKKSIGLDFGTRSLRLAHLESGQPRMLGTSIPLWKAVGLEEGQKIRLPVKALLDDNEQVDLEGKSFAWSDLATHIFLHARQQAELAIGEPVEGCVVGVASMTGMLKREILHTALRKAGFRLVRLLNEPLAVALSQPPPEQDEKRLLIYCMGSGSPDVSIAVRNASTLRELATGSERGLSGEFLTIRVHQYLKDHPEIKNEADDSLWKVAEQIKIHLSERQEIHLAEYAPSMPGDSTLTRQAFEDLIRLDLQPSVDLCRSLMEEAGLPGPGDLNEIILFGNSTRIPLLHRMLAELSGKTPRQADENAVALGAAVHTSSLDFSEAESPAEERHSSRKADPPERLFAPRISLFEAAVSGNESEQTTNTMQAIGSHLARAEGALAEGEFEAALQELRAIEQLSRKQMADVNVLKAHSLEKQGDIQSAQKAFAEALKHDPDHPEANLIEQHQRARLYYRDGRKEEGQKRYKAAYRLYRKAYENHKENSDYRNACAAMLLQIAFRKIKAIAETRQQKPKFIRDSIERVRQDLQEVMDYHPSMGEIKKGIESAEKMLAELAARFLREG